MELNLNLYCYVASLPAYGGLRNKFLKYMPKNTEEIKENIKKLVDKYNNLKDQDKIKDFNEAQTRNEFIEPLFEFLGWDMRNLNIEGEVITEEKNSNGRVDLAFRINGIPKFFLEAKSMKTDLDNDIYARQAINYSWNKGVTWAVLTDFEAIKIFNAQAESNKLRDKLVFEINYDEYITDFDRLWLLSKESFQNNALDIYAEKHGKKSKKITVNEKLFDDFKKAREILTKSFKLWNKDVDKELLDEGVQRILDRLIFIRVLEDRGLEQPILKPIIREWEKDRQKQLFHMLIEKFRELDIIYNSNLFIEHACEKWEEYDDSIKKVALLFYGNDMYEYDFKGISADVLGGVYESYLSYIAQNPIKVEAKDGKLLQIGEKGEIKEKSRKKRKEQGIFYTPKFIVDYIVKNALGKKLKEINNVNDLKKIKILDPACGSGSFLTKALETMNDKYQEFGYKGDQNNKTEILLSNIYGVDLDVQAVELAKLNLLIDALDKREKLPNLTKNIRVGNSLISGTEKELEKYFGKNWREKKPFNWEEKFSEVFKQGGFDVIIGNPPWVSLKGKQKSIDFSEDELKYFSQKFGSNTYRPNLFEMFIYQSLLLLKENGLFSFIVPDRLCANQQFIELRENILKNFCIERLWFKVKFPGIIGDTVIFVIKKTKPQNNKLKMAEYPNENTVEFEQKKFFEKEDKAFSYASDKIQNIFEKIAKETVRLDTIVNSSVGFIAKSGKISKERTNDEQMAILKGENIIKYGNYGNFFFNFEKNNLAGGTQDKQKLGHPQKIFIRKTGIDILASYVEGDIYPEQSLYFLYGGNKKLMLSLLAILNSKLINIYYRNFAITNRDATPQLKKVDLDKFPIINFNEENKNYLSILSQKMLDFNKQLVSIPKDSDKWNLVKEEIEKTDKLIDQKVYELYGLTEEEIKIVENK